MPATNTQKKSMRVAQLHAYGAPDREIAEARRELAVAKLEDAVARILASAPPLHPAQRERVIDLLLSSGR